MLSSKWQPFSQLLFSGAKMAALSKDVERARSWLLEEDEFGRRDRSIPLPLILSDYTEGRFLTGPLNVNHGGVLLLHYSSVSLHFSWSWPQSE